MIINEEGGAICPNPFTATALTTRQRMAATDLSDEEIDYRYNHWDDIDVERCKQGHFVSKPAPENGQVRYRCSACSKWYLEYTGPN